MPTRAGIFALSIVTLALAACDSVHEDCAPSSNPSAAPGAHRDACPRSEFKAEDLRAREVGGVVRRGEDVVPGAHVRVESSAGFVSGQAAAPASTVTDAVGFFYGLRPVALRYDLFARLDRIGGEPDVMVFRGLGNRYIEPALEGPRTFARAWSSHIEPRFTRPIPPGHSVAYFASGDGVYAVSGDETRGLTFLTREFELRGVLHAIEYETAGGLEKATAYGRADVVLSATLTRQAAIAFAPIERTAEPKFETFGPPGFAASAVQIRLGFTRTSDAILATIPLGTSRPLPLVPDAGYTYQVVAANGGVVSDTGETIFDPRTPLTTVVLPPPPVVSMPLEGETRKIGETLLVDGDGVFEHVLEPEGAGPSIRIITGQREAVLPDVGVLGVPEALGGYRWTVRSYPSAHFAEELGGLDARRYRPMSTSVPRRIVLRRASE